MFRMVRPWLLVLALLITAGCARRGAGPAPAPAAAPPATTGHEAPAPTATEAAPDAEAARIEFDPALFALDSDRLDQAARAALDRAVRILRDRPALAVVIEGHCDERGTFEYNQALGQRRAEAARDYLVAAGIEESRIDVVSYGRERPLVDGHDESAWSQNRRAHLVAR